VVRLRVNPRCVSQLGPDTGVTLGWDPATPSKLSYAPAGFIKSIAVGNGANPTTMCSFSAANQLDHIIILNVP